jgi:hypothetical protein
MINQYFKDRSIFFQSYNGNLPSSIFFNNSNTVVYELIYLFRIYYEDITFFLGKLKDLALLTRIRKD